MEDDAQFQSSFVAPSKVGGRTRRSIVAPSRPPSYTSSFYNDAASPSSSSSSSYSEEPSSIYFALDGDKRALEEEDDFREKRLQCSFCGFHFKKLQVADSFCWFECALGFSRSSKDLYDAYYALAASCISPHLQAPYSPKPGVDPTDDEQHDAYVERNIQALYSNSRHYEIDRYRQSQSGFLSEAEAVVFHQAVEASSSKKTHSNDNIGLKIKNPLSSPKPDLALVATDKNWEFDAVVDYKGKRIVVGFFTDGRNHKLRIQNEKTLESHIFAHSVKAGEVLNIFFDDPIKSSTLKVTKPSNAKQILLASELYQEDGEPIQAFVDDGDQIGKNIVTKLVHSARGHKTKFVIAVSGTWPYNQGNQLTLAKWTTQTLKGGKRTTEYKMYYGTPTALGGTVIFVKNGQERQEFVTAKSIIRVDFSKWGDWLQMIKFPVRGKSGTSTEEYDRYVADIQKGKHTSRLGNEQGLVVASMDQEGGTAAVVDYDDQIGRNYAKDLVRSARGVNTKFLIGVSGEWPYRRNNRYTLEKWSSPTFKGVKVTHFQMYYEPTNDGKWNIVLMKNGQEQRFLVKPHSVVRVDFNEWDQPGKFYSAISANYDYWKRGILEGKHTKRWENQVAFLAAPIDHKEFFPNFH